MKIKTQVTLSFEDVSELLTRTYEAKGLISPKDTVNLRAKMSTRQELGKYAKKKEIPVFEGLILEIETDTEA